MLRPTFLLLALLTGVSQGFASLPPPSSSLALPPSIQQNSAAPPMSSPLTLHSKPAESRYTLDEFLDEVQKDIASRPIALQFSPNRSNLWFRFKGTILQKTWKSALFFTLFNVLLCLKVHLNLVPLFRENMEKLDKLWHMQMSLTTFILAFFLNRGASVWNDMNSYGRRIQGRLNDISILCATHVKRDEDGKVLYKSQVVLDTIARYKRLFPILFYSSIVKSHKILQSNEALDGMQTRGMITEEEKILLKEMPGGGRHHAVIQWIGNVMVAACEDDEIFHQHSNLHYTFLDKMCQLRSTYGSVPDKIDDRLNMAYAHFVQLLVDSFLFVTPFAALADMGNFSPFATFVLTMFFQGLLDLSKMFLDPFNNEGQGDDGDYLVVNTYIQEGNAGSERFKRLTKRFPKVF
ncbi:hypothetical protein TrLO_g5449 [Triparma laevis f. longispina]|uniref:Uncharacterized protein n=1 Tax=Triparma laevis f. longispina TaxID=1714387 RepID=A0A9W7DVB3_9STRA|nr:hypothetical protein TrLO_g5449 [Triparma laevis f. longispina]